MPVDCSGVPRIVLREVKWNTRIQQTADEAETVLPGTAVNGAHRHRVTRGHPENAPDPAEKSF